MKFFTRATMARRLALSYACVIAVFLAVSGVTLYTGMQMKKTEQVSALTYRTIGNGTTMLQAMTDLVASSRGYLVSGKESYLDALLANMEQFEAAWESAKTLTAGDAQQQQRLDGMKADLERLVAESKALVGTRMSVQEGVGTEADFQAAFGAGRSDAAIAAFRAHQEEFSKAALTSLGQQLTLSAKLRMLNDAVVVGGAVLAILAAVLMAYFGVRKLVGQIGGEPDYAADIVRQIAAGNLTVAVETRPGDTTSLLAAMREMSQRLAGIVGNVRRNAEGVAMSSTQIAAGNADLSARTEAQASSLEETAAAMEQLGSTVRGNAENAQQANQLARAASEVAGKGGEAVSQVVRTMKEISESSKQIADIIGVIDGIAFQTNILALNSAVEAARAGEQGRGFAVVASEVRSLAKRSADAAKEIKTLIGQSVERVDQGTAQVDQAGATIMQVVESIRRVTDIVGEISSASIEQSTGVAQVGESVASMDRNTQQNAALVEQSAAAAEGLRRQADLLVDAVAAFTLESQAAVA